MKVCVQMSVKGWSPLSLLLLKKYVIFCTKFEICSANLSTKVCTQICVSVNGSVFTTFFRASVQLWPEM